MTSIVTIPDFHIRGKINELDSATIPWSKMPMGSCIGSGFYFSNGTSGEVNINSGDQNSSGYVLDPTFTYYKKEPNSLLYVQYFYAPVNPVGYFRETIHFDHNTENAWEGLNGTFITTGGSVQAASTIDRDEHLHDVGIIGGYVVGPNGNNVTSADAYYFNTKTFGGFVRYPSRFCSFAFALATSGSVRFRDDKYFSTKAMVLEFKQ